MLDKINVIRIVTDHYSTLKRYNRTNICKSDLLTFVALPFLLAVVSAYLNLKFTDPIINILISALAIFSGLLFNLLVLLHAIKIRNVNYINEKDTKDFFKQIYANISYALFISILIVTLLCIVIFFRSNAAVTLNLRDPILVRFGNGVIFFLLAQLMLTLLMILKRMYFFLLCEFKY
jgi:hypothetical protein